MSAPTPEQLGNYEWWEKNAPSDATHIHLRPDGRSQWVKVNLTGPFNFYWHERFSEWQRKESPDFGETVARPEKPQPPEWNGEGNPPIGCECEYVIGTDRYPVTVVGYHDGEVVVFQHESAPDYVGVQPGYLQPQRTKEQRDYDDLIKLLFSGLKAQEIAENIIAAGWRKGEK